MKVCGVSAESRSDASSPQYLSQFISIVEHKMKKLSATVLSFICFSCLRLALTTICGSPSGLMAWVLAAVRRLGCALEYQLFVCTQYLSTSCGSQSVVGTAVPAVARHPGLVCKYRMWQGKHSWRRIKYFLLGFTVRFKREICNKVHVILPTAHTTCHYTTLWKT